MKKTFLLGMAMVMMTSAALAGNGQVGSVGQEVLKNLKQDLVGYYNEEYGFRNSAVKDLERLKNSKSFKSCKMNPSNCAQAIEETAGVLFSAYVSNYALAQDIEEFENSVKNLTQDEKALLSRIKKAGDDIGTIDELNTESRYELCSGEESMECMLAVYADVPRPLDYQKLLKIIDKGSQSAKSSIKNLEKIKTSNRDLIRAF